MLMLMGDIKKGDVFRYMALPGIKPRIKAFFSSGFQYIAFYIAQVYLMVRLLPEGHPYTNPSNMGRFGIRHVIAEASNQLQFSWRNLDQIILFFVILLGLIIGALQLSLLFLSFAFPSVMAAMPTNFADFFVTPNPEQDIAGIFMDLVFGIPGLFDSCVAAGNCIDLKGEVVGGRGLHVSTFLGGLDPSSTIPFAIHDGMHQLLQVYSYGLLVVAVFVTIYFIFTIFAETAQSGTPFGKRFEKVWAPLRLVVAFGLLIPVGAHGLNASQYLVLYAAKFGSAFATNGWIIFNETLTATYVGETEDLVAKSNPPEVGALLQFLFTARTCHEYHFLNSVGSLAAAAGGIEIAPYAVRSTNSDVPRLKIDRGTPFQDLLKFADGENKVTINFGEYNPQAYPMSKGHVKPICGQMHIRFKDARAFSIVNGSTVMGEEYFELVKRAYFTIFGGGEKYPKQFVKEYTTNETVSLPKEDFKNLVISGYKGYLNLAVQEAIDTEVASDRWEEEMEQMTQRGWAGAAIWYNRIAEMNGALTTSILNVPTPVLYPETMEMVRKRKEQTDSNILVSERFNPKLKDEQYVDLDESRKTEARILYEAFSYWTDTGHVSSSHTVASGNFFLDIINALFGTSGLFDMRENKDVHPLAQLSAIGRSLVEASIENAGLAVMGGLGGSVLSSFAGLPAQLAGVAAGFLVTIITMALTVGWVLFYVVPFLPFIYFFFAVGGWIQGVLEAMVGAPLWALAHLRIDGKGLSGQAASGGYYLILEVFLRPIMIVFGLLASINIFSAMVLMLNEVFDLVVNNLTGFNPEDTSGLISMEMFRGPVDEFVFTLMYAVIVYLLAMSSFKLIDAIPNNILRWMGQSVQSFNDSNKDPAGSLMSTAWLGGQQTISSLGGGLKGMSAIAGPKGGGG